MHQIIEINTVKPGGTAPTGHLAVDVIEPEGEMQDENAADEADRRSRADCRCADEVRDESGEGHLVGGKS